MIVVVLTAAEARHLAAALAEHGRELRHNGLSLPPRLAALATDLLRPAGATGGHDWAPVPGAADDGAADRPLLRATEAAALLRVSTRSLRRLAASGKVPSVRLGSRRLYRRADLDECMAALPSGQRR